MTQNLVAIEFSPADLEAIDGALAVLEAKLGILITLSADERRKAIKMGDKSEVFCRQTELVLRQNPGIVPSNFDLAGLQQDIVALDALRSLQQRLRTLTDRIQPGDPRTCAGLQVAFDPHGGAPAHFRADEDRVLQKVAAEFAIHHR